MRTREIHAAQSQWRSIGRGRAWLLKIWGPAESWDHPLVGTQYDPTVRQRRAQVRRAERRPARPDSGRAREEQRRVREGEPADQYTPDE
jgi:hypothetical protein